MNMGEPSAGATPRPKKNRCVGGTAVRSVIWSVLSMPNTRGSVHGSWSGL